MEYMYLGWYVIVCGRNGESYDSSSCTWSICILAGTLFKNLSFLDIRISLTEGYV
jgi:hypothetical protein